MTLLLPHALLLLLPLALLLWRTGRVRGPAFWLRGGLVLVLVLALAEPVLVLRAAGSDVVVVVDRSRSMPPGSDVRAEEAIRLLEPQRRPGDRLAVVTFGREPRVEMAAEERASFGGFGRPVDADASDLAAALDVAAELIPPERAGRVIVLSDGRATGVEPRGAARRLAARGVPVDHRWLGREDGGLDVAVVELGVPPSVARHEPFLLSATLHASRAVRGTVSLRRGGRALASGPAELHPGENVLVFRDLVDEPGLVTYELAVEAPGDGVPENDRGRAVLRVEGPPRVLVLSEGGRRTGLAAALEKAGLELAVRAPAALSMDALDGVGAVVLENVEAGGLGEQGMRVLAQYVEDAGGGLVMTGGRKSFGQGGYRKSPIEPLLPVSLEIRQEERKAAVALALLMDSSCSMGVTIPDGRTKMELAGEGAVAALQLLGDTDEASVHMVDTEPKELLPMSPVRGGLPLAKVARGFSGGGGIYIGEALRAGRDEVLKSRKVTRHVLLFADASDSEEPADYKKTLAELRANQVTVSVIGMGTPRDSDARLLEEIASLGGGRIYFADDVTSLPRMFSQETILIARASFVDGPVGIEAGADLSLLGRLSPAGLPSIGGYNLTYLRPLASVALRSVDDHRAPVLSFWPRGAGRVVAYAGEVDGEHTGAIRGWPGYRALLEQMVRWTLGGQVGGVATDMVARARRAGNDLHVTVDFDPAAPPPATPPTLLVLSSDASQPPVELPLRWEDGDRMGAHFPLPRSGTFHPVVRVGERALRVPPVTLPYAPEYEPAPAEEGKALLAELAGLTGGVERLSMEGVFAQARQSAAGVPLAPYLVGLSVVGLLGEVLVRRFLSAMGRGTKKKKAAAGRKASKESVAPRAAVPVQAPEPARPRPSTDEQPDKPPAPEVATGGTDSVKRALEAARERAQRRLKR